MLFAGVLNSAGVATDYSFQLVKNVSAEKPVAEGTYLLQGNRTIGEGVVLRFPELDSWSYGKWVDMGSAGKWATGNLTDDGRTTVSEDNIVAPDAPGGYYAWGEYVKRTLIYVEEHRMSYVWPYANWKSYSLANLDKEKLTKYCTQASYADGGRPDNLSVLEDADDAATRNIGEKWRTPTKAECEKLVDKNNFGWAWQNSGYATRGSLVTCTANGLSMFLPAAGFAGGVDEYYIYKVNERGNYWASEINKSIPNQAYNVFFQETTDPRVSAGERQVVFSIRPVLK